MSRKQITKATTATPAPVIDDAFGELADFFDEVGVDGLEDVGGEDVRLAVILWNMRGLDKRSKPYPRDVFYNTITEDTAETIDAVFLLSQKTKRWDEYDNALEKTVVHCESRDRITGTRSDGTRRPCAGCPDDGWFTDDDGKARRRCGEIHNVVAVDRLTQKPFAIRFKKTGLKPWRNHLMAHHWGARAAIDPKTKKRVRANVPMFCYASQISLKMHESGNYATPAIEPIEQGRDARGNPSYLLPVDDVKAYGESAKAYLDVMGDVLDHTDTQASAHDSAPRDDALSANDFAD